MGLTSTNNTNFLSGSQKEFWIGTINRNKTADPQFIEFDDDSKWISDFGKLTVHYKTRQHAFGFFIWEAAGSLPLNSFSKVGRTKLPYICQYECPLVCTPVPGDVPNSAYKLASNNTTNDQSTPIFRYYTVLFIITLHSYI